MTHLMLNRKYEGLVLGVNEGFSLLSLDIVHSLQEPAGDPRCGGVAQGRGLPEPRRPEVARVRVVARVEAGQVGAVWGAQSATYTTDTA